MTLNVSLLQLAKQSRRAGTSGRIQLRNLLHLPPRKTRISGFESPFSILTQNMALLPDIWPFSKYLGKDRDAAVATIILKIVELQPDFVGLCEVFVNDEREQIRDTLRHIYPFYSEGPDQSIDLEDGGLLLLSKHPIISAHHHIFHDTVGDDKFSSKGVIHVRLAPAGSPMHFDVYYTHTQNLAEDGGKDVLYGQLSLIGSLIPLFSDTKMPTLIMGDLNIPGEDASHYAEMITRLGGPSDLWQAAGNPPGTGATFSTENVDFFEDLDSDHVATQNQRLDYLLLKPGTQFIPLLESIAIEKFKHEKGLISDHFGLFAKFQFAARIDGDA